MQRNAHPHIVIVEAFLVMATQPILGQPPKKAPKTEPMPSPSKVLERPGFSRRLTPIIAERFL